MQSKGGRHQIHAAQLKFVYVRYQDMEMELPAAQLKYWQWIWSVAQCQFISLIKAKMINTLSTADIRDIGEKKTVEIDLVLWLLHVGVYPALVQTENETETFYFSNAFY